MKEIEIQGIPPLSPGEMSQVNLHSILNVLNVLMGQLMITGHEVADDERHFAQGLRAGEQILATLSDPNAAIKIASQMSALRETVLGEFEAKVPAHMLHDRETVHARANLRSVFTILEVRAREILARAQRPDQMERLVAARLTENFHTFFAAIERNSHGRYRIVRCIALKGPIDYYLDFRIESSLYEGPVQRPYVYMPPVLEEVMRDLIANARKYTEVGGNIISVLRQDHQGVTFVVEDNGRGIPPEQIEEVVHFGKRASNVDDVRTMGGGFGLTKAFLVTKQFGGKLWIASELGRGTRVRFHLPVVPPGASPR